MTLNASQLIFIFDKTYLAYLQNNQKGILVGIAYYEQGPVVEGSASELEKLAEEWNSKGGESSIAYEVNNSFKTGKLYRSDIYMGMKFYLCSDEKEVPEKTEILKKEINELNYLAGVIIEQKL
jgi:hypothetical protein